MDYHCTYIGNSKRDSDRYQLNWINFTTGVKQAERKKKAKKKTN